MSLITRADFPIFMRQPSLDALRKGFDQTTGLFEEMRGDYYNVDSTTDPFYQEFGMVGVGNARRKKEGVPTTYDAPAMGRPFTMVFPAYSLAVAISREAQDDDKTNILVPTITKELARAMVETKEEDAIAQYNDGFIYQGWEADGVALFSTSHPVQRSGRFQSNAHPTAAALSITSLDAAYTTLRTTRNETDRWMSEMKPSFLDVAPALVPDAMRIIGTEKVLGSNNNDKNLYYRQLQVRANPRFNRASRWFLQCSSHKWLWKDRVKTELLTDVDKIAGVTILMVYARWGRGASDWRGKYGSDAP